MNHYTQALAELQAAPAHTLKQIGDQWQTPKALAWGLFQTYLPTLGPVVLDMFADDCNHLLPHYYDAADNALTQDLAADLRRLGGAAFANPPYSRPCVDGEGNPITGMEPILSFCREQRAQGAKIMLLIKAAVSETWWPEDADCIQFISGRIGFDVPSWYLPADPKKDRPSSSGFASAVVIFDASWPGERRPERRLRRDDLITTGQLVLDMIHRQAVALNEAASSTVTAPHQQPIKKTDAAPSRASTDVAADTGALGQGLAANQSRNVLRMVRGGSGQWAAHYLVNDQEVAGVAGCLTADEALLHAAELGWQWDHVVWPADIAPNADTPQHHPDYAEPGRYLVRYIDEVAALNQADQATLRQYLTTWFNDGETPAEICYRLVLAADNLHAARPMGHGFTLPTNRTATLPHWQRHPAVKAIIYQIDDADILTPAKTAELAGWVINNLTAPDLLTLATNKAAELLAQSAGQPAEQAAHTAEQAEQAEQRGEPAAEPQQDQTLADWAYDYQHNELNLGSADWSRFVIVLTLLYGVRDRYTPRQVAIAISICDEALMEEYTTLPEAEKSRLRDAVAAFTRALRKLDGCPDDVIQHAVIAFDQQRTADPVGAQQYVHRALLLLSQTAIDQHDHAAVQDEEAA